MPIWSIIRCFASSIKLGFAARRFRYSAIFFSNRESTIAVPATGPIAQTTSHKLTIGAFERSGEVSKFYDGYIDEVRVYDEALDAAAIQALVPEPATIALLGLGGLLLRRRRS